MFKISKFSSFSLLIQQGREGGKEGGACPIVYSIGWLDFDRPSQSRPTWNKWSQALKERSRSTFFVKRQHIHALFCSPIPLKWTLRTKLKPPSVPKARGFHEYTMNGKSKALEFIRTLAVLRHCSWVPLLGAFLSSIFLIPTVNPLCGSPTNQPIRQRTFFPSLSRIPFNCRCDSRFEIHLRFSLSIDTRLPFSRPWKCMVWVIRSFRTPYTSLDLPLCYHHATTHSLLRIESEYQVRFQSYRHGCWSDLFERSGVKI